MHPRLSRRSGSKGLSKVAMARIPSSRRRLAPACAGKLAMAVPIHGFCGPFRQPAASWPGLSQRSTPLGVANEAVDDGDISAVAPALRRAVAEMTMRLGALRAKVAAIRLFVRQPLKFRAPRRRSTIHHNGCWHDPAPRRAANPAHLLLLTDGHSDERLQMKRRQFLKSMTALAAGSVLPAAPAIWSAAKAQSRQETVLAVTEYGPNNFDIHGVGTNRPGYEVAWNCYDRLMTHGKKTLPDGVESYDRD